jgi:hypothetical protein
MSAALVIPAVKPRAALGNSSSKCVNLKRSMSVQERICKGNLAPFIRAVSVVQVI